MFKAIPVKFVCCGQTNALSGSLQGASSHQSMGYWPEGSEVLNQSLTEVPAQSG